MMSLSQYDSQYLIVRLYHINSYHILIVILIAVYEAAFMVI